MDEKPTRTYENDEIIVYWYAMIKEILSGTIIFKQN